MRASLTRPGVLLADVVRTQYSAVEHVGGALRGSARRPTDRAVLQTAAAGEQVYAPPSVFILSPGRRIVVNARYAIVRDSVADQLANGLENNRTVIWDAAAWCGAAAGTRARQGVDYVVRESWLRRFHPRCAILLDYAGPRVTRRSSAASLG